MSPDELRLRLTEWIDSLGNIQVAVDSGIDFDFLREVLIPWPMNVDPTPLFFTGGVFADTVNEAYFEIVGLRQHHALDDAITNRIGWLTSQTR